jgi:methionine biosynthesis protein MetW
VSKNGRYTLPDPSSVLTDELICPEIARGEHVVDLGCGDARLLARLRDEHDCSVLGVELDDRNFLSAIRRGVSVLKLDLDENLSDLPDNSFDWAVLTQTLQEVRHPKVLLSEMLRIARRAIVVVPNFANWKVRLQILQYGKAPVTEALPYEWYDTPNLHFLSLSDFRDLVTNLGFRIVKETHIIRGKAVERAWLANLRAESGFFVLEGTAESIESAKTS